MLLIGRAHRQVGVGDRDVKLVRRAPENIEEIVDDEKVCVFLRGYVIDDKEGIDRVGMGLGIGMLS